MRKGQAENSETEMRPLHKFRSKDSVSAKTCLIPTTTKHSILFPNFRNMQPSLAVNASLMHFILLKNLLFSAFQAVSTTVFFTFICVLS